MELVVLDWSRYINVLLLLAVETVDASPGQGKCDKGWTAKGSFFTCVFQIIAFKNEKGTYACYAWNVIHVNLLREQRGRR